MIRGQAPHFELIVHHGPGKQPRQRVIQIHGGDPDRENTLGQPGGAHQGDDPLHLPFPEHRPGIFQTAGLDLQRPGSVETSIVGDSSQQPAAISGGGLDQQRDGRRFRHRFVIIYNYDSIQ